MNRLGKSNGFSIIELVVAMFLIAIVLGGVLLLLAANLNVVDKANEIMRGKALLQFSNADLENIEFPPVYHDRQDNFGDRVTVVRTDPDSGYEWPENIDPAEDGVDWLGLLPGGVPDEIQADFILKRFNFRYSYDPVGGLMFLNNSTIDDSNLTLLHRVDTYVLRRDGGILLEHTAYISRNGMF